MANALTLSMSALALGAAHSFSPDHLAAVSVFVSESPSWRRALSLGARWGLGHSLTIVVVGSVLAITGARLRDQFSLSTDRVVGLVLVVIGLLAITRALRARRSVAQHAHPHGAAAGAAHEHPHRT
ncbi:MAG: hypothetical protein JO180_02740, partial [Gemmatirosa sp.]|nr:hypothetical protein [Gemmatirosa sp.]